MTRRWRDYKTLMKHIRLVLIDEVHFVKEPNRGATLEVVVSRMNAISLELSKGQNIAPLRMVAISATIPNLIDIAEWLKDDQGKRAEMRCLI